MFQKIKVVNHRSIKSFNIDNVSDVVIFEGRNYQGKTNLIRAIRWGIVGGNDSNCINHEEDETRVVLTGDTGAVIERSLLRDAKKSRLSVTVKDRTVPDPEEFLKTYYSAYCFDPIGFCTLSAKEQATVIRTALAARVSMTPEEAEKCGFTLDPKAPVMDQLDHFYDHYYSERKVLNAKIDQYKKSSKSIDVTTIPTKEEIDELEANISKMQTEISSINKQNAIAEAAKTNVSTKNKLERDLEAIDAEIETLDSNDDVETLKSDLKKKKTAFETSSSEESELRGRVKQLDKTLENLGESDCPTCPLSDKITCTTNITPVKDKMKTELSKMKTALKNMNEANRKLSDEIAEIEKMIVGLDQLKDKKIERDRIKATIDSIIVSDVEVVDTKPYNDTLSEAQSRLSSMKTAFALGASCDIETIQAERNKFDKFVKEISNFKDVELPKRAELGIPNLKLRDTGLYFKGTPLSEESTSIQLRLAVTIMKILYPKNNILTMDRIESVDEENLTKLITSLLKDGSRQVFATYVGKVPDAIRKMDNVTVYKIEDGKIV